VAAGTLWPTRAGGSRPGSPASESGEAAVGARI
jgi:hypothetical protein